MRWQATRTNEAPSSGFPSSTSTRRRSSAAIVTKLQKRGIRRTGLGDPLGIDGGGHPVSTGARAGG
jgi:hypothetical protein